MSGAVLSVDLEKLDNTSGYIVSRDVAAAATVVVDFLQEFNGIAKNVLLSNLDPANPAQWRVNSRGTLLRTLRPAQDLNIGSAVELLEVIAGAGAGVQITAEIVPRELILPP